MRLLILKNTWGKRIFIWLRKKKEGSVTIESSFVMPLVIACILLLLSMNFYMHDLIILQSLANEIVHSSELKDAAAEEYFQNQARERAFIVEDASWSYENGTFKRTGRFSKKLLLPLSDFMKSILKDTDVSLKGKAECKQWEMSDILRYITNKKEGRD